MAAMPLLAPTERLTLELILNAVFAQPERIAWALERRR
jgi:hypothetical protein